MTVQPLISVELPVVRCSVCEVAYVLRRVFSFGEAGEHYVYQRDCRHKSAPPADVGLDEWSYAGVAREVDKR